MLTPQRGGGKGGLIISLVNEDRDLQNGSDLTVVESGAQGLANVPPYSLHSALRCYETPSWTPKHFRLWDLTGH